MARSLYLYNDFTEVHVVGCTGTRQLGAGCAPVTVSLQPFCGSWKPTSPKNQYAPVVDAGTVRLGETETSPFQPHSPEHPQRYEKPQGGAHSSVPCAIGTLPVCTKPSKGKAQPKTTGTAPRVRSPGPPSKPNRRPRSALLSRNEIGVVVAVVHGNGKSVILVSAGQ